MLSTMSTSGAAPEFAPSGCAAGAATGGLDGGPYSGYVGGLSKAATFGLRGAEHVGEFLAGRDATSERIATA